MQFEGLIEKTMDQSDREELTATSSAVFLSFKRRGGRKMVVFGEEGRVPSKSTREGALNPWVRWARPEAEGPDTEIIWPETSTLPGSLWCFKSFFGSIAEKAWNAVRWEFRKRNRNEDVPAASLSPSGLLSLENGHSPRAGQPLLSYIRMYVYQLPSKSRGDHFKTT